MSSKQIKRIQKEMKQYEDNKEDINNKNKIDILPMIDIIFSILAFLIISSLYLTRVETVSVELPMASNTITQNKKFINISIDKGGNFSNKLDFYKDTINSSWWSFCGNE